jgi:hypothetical protein
MLKRLLRMCTLLAVSAVPAVASPIDLWVDDAVGNLGTVDISTGTVTLIGNSGVVLTDIAFSPTGVLYGVDFNNLYTINTSTGHASVVGSLGAAFDANALVFGSDGTLYTATTNGSGTNALYTINPATGHGTLVGPLGFSSGGDLAFINGTLFLSTSANQLVTVNPSTGAGTLVGNIGVANVFGLATPDNSTLYGVAGQDVYLLDTSTGAGTLVLNYGGHGLGIANGESFIAEATNPQSPPPIGVTPEPSPIILVGSSIFLLLSGRSLSRRVAHR